MFLNSPRIYFLFPYFWIGDVTKLLPIFEKTALHN